MSSIFVGFLLTTRMICCCVALLLNTRKFYVFLVLRLKKIKIIDTMINSLFSNKLGISTVYCLLGRDKVLNLIPKRVKLKNSRKEKLLGNFANQYL